MSAMEANAYEKGRGKKHIVSLICCGRNWNNSTVDHHNRRLLQLRLLKVIPDRAHRNSYLGMHQGSAYRI